MAMEVAPQAEEIVEGVAVVFLQVVQQTPTGIMVGVGRLLVIVWEELDNMLAGLAAAAAPAGMETVADPVPVVDIRVVVAEIM